LVAEIGDAHFVLLRIHRMTVAAMVRKRARTISSAVIYCPSSLFVPSTAHPDRPS